MALNRFVCSGRFTSDPEFKRFDSGSSIATFTVAVERDYKDKNTGKRGVDFIRFVAYKSQAEHIKSYFCKGMLANIDGRLQIRDFIDKDGNKRYVPEVIVNNIYFGESKKAQQNISESSSNSESADNQNWSEIEDDGTLPF